MKKLDGSLRIATLRIDSVSIAAAASVTNGPLAPAAPVSAAIRAAVLAPFGRELRQISPRAISDVTGAGGQDYGDVLIVPELFEDREQLAYNIPAQSISLLRPIDRNLRHCVARFEYCKFAFPDHEFYLS